MDVLIDASLSASPAVAAICIVTMPDFAIKSQVSFESSEDALMDGTRVGKPLLLLIPVADISHVSSQLMLLLNEYQVQF